MVELFLVLFFLSIGICLCFEFYGGRGGKEVVSEFWRIVIKKEFFVCFLEMEFFFISWNKFIFGMVMVIKIKCFFLYRWIYLGI